MTGHASDEAIAHHEAGHVVTAIGLGQVVRSSRIHAAGAADPSGGTYVAWELSGIGDVSPCRATWARIALALAGEIAEEVWLGERSTGGDSDHENTIRVISGYLPYEEILESRLGPKDKIALAGYVWRYTGLEISNRVRDFLSRVAVRQAGERIAQALLDRRGLNRKEIAAIVTPEQVGENEADWKSILPTARDEQELHALKRVVTEEILLAGQRSEQPVPSLHRGPSDGASTPTRDQLFHGAVAMSLACEQEADPVRREALEAVAGWLRGLYIAGGSR